jgi:hypothetical protein
MNELNEWRVLWNRRLRLREQRRTRCHDVNYVCDYVSGPPTHLFGGSWICSLIHQSISNNEVRCSHWWRCLWFRQRHYFFKVNDSTK